MTRNVGPDISATMKGEGMSDDNIYTPPPRRAPVRPHGGGLMISGWTLMVLGLVGLFIAVKADAWWAIWPAAGSISLGLLLWPLGVIVRALFFLPGRAVEWDELQDVLK